MSQTTTVKNKPHKLQIRQKCSGISNGANTEVFLDEQPLRGVKFLKLEFHAAKVTKVMLEMFVEAENIVLDTILDEKGKVVEQNNGTNWVLGKFSSITASEIKQTKKHQFTLLEAIESGKPFKRPEDKYYGTKINDASYGLTLADETNTLRRLTPKDLTAADWQLMGVYEEGSGAEFD